jgi:hypothetical protein
MSAGSRRCRKKEIVKPHHSRKSLRRILYRTRIIGGSSLIRFNRIVVKLQAGTVTQKTPAQKNKANAGM